VPFRLILPWIFAATVCGLRPRASSEHQRDQEEIEIYAALLGAEDGGPPPVIEGTAQPFWYPMPAEVAQSQTSEAQKNEGKYFGERFDGGVQQSTVDDYFKRTLAASPLRTTASPPKDWVILPSESDGGERRVAGDTLVFSRVGFSDDDQQALVMFGAHRKSGGRGEMCLMQKRNGHWIIGSRTGAWIEDIDRRRSSSSP
jgi:hypothetical protein